MTKKIDITSLKRLKSYDDFNDFIDNAPIGEKVIYGFQAPPMGSSAIRRAIDQKLITSISMVSKLKDREGNRMFYYIAVKLANRVKGL
jgi:hypothetical protein